LGDGRRRAVIEEVPGIGLPKGNDDGRHGHKADRVASGADEQHDIGAGLVAVTMIPDSGLSAWEVSRSWVIWMFLVCDEFTEHSIQENTLT
jgi:hypothetical protein